MWDGFFGAIGASISNVAIGFGGSIGFSNTFLQSTPPPQVEDSNESDQDKEELKEISKYFNLEIANAINAPNEKKTRLLGDLIAEPNSYQNLLLKDKKLVTQAVIEDFKIFKEQKRNKLPHNMQSKIDEVLGDNKTYLSSSDVNLISDIYIHLNKNEKPNQSFQCERANLGHDPARGLEPRGRRSQNTFDPPPALFPDAKEKENRTPAQRERSKEMQDKMRRHIESERRKGGSHPAGQRPITNLPKWHSNQGLRTGRDAMNYVLDRGFTPQHALITGYDTRNTSQVIDKQIKDAKRVDKKQWELTQNDLNRINKVGGDPDSGSINKGRTKSLNKELHLYQSSIRKAENTSALLAAIDYTTQSSKPTRPSRVASASLDKTGKLPRTSPGQPLSARSASLSNGTVRRQ